MDQILLLSMINPMILLVLAILFGILCFEATPLKMPVFVGLAKRNLGTVDYSTLLKSSIGLGICIAVTIAAIAMLFHKVIPDEMDMIYVAYQPHWLTRFGYAGFTEEILIRFGLMTVLCWTMVRIFKKEALSIWAAIFLSSIIFGLAHLPIVYQLLQSPSQWIVVYVIFTNNIGGMGFGWLYWKRGLEASMIAHFITHAGLITLSAIS